jgi:hypothetical protein
MDLLPDRGQMLLTVSTHGPLPDVTGLNNIDVYPTVENGVEETQLRVTVSGGPHAAFALLAEIADRVHLRGQPLASAVVCGLADHGALLDTRTGLGRERETGLFGELLVVEHLVRQDVSNLSQWTGADGDEHDFKWANWHVEVKTTTTERRCHWISTLTQLLPDPDASLYVLSLQLTIGAPGRGRTLAELVTGLRDLVGPGLSLLDQRLIACGWHDRDADLYRTRWALRSRPMLYAVDAEFPRVVPDSLRRATVHPDLISDVRYRVDLTSLSPAAPIAPLLGLVPEEHP